jgi:hypothetical protein
MTVTAPSYCWDPPRASITPSKEPPQFSISWRKDKRDAEPTTTLTADYPATLIYPTAMVTEKPFCGGVCVFQCMQRTTTDTNLGVTARAQGIETFTVLTKPTPLIWDLGCTVTPTVTVTGPCCHVC